MPHIAISHITICITISVLVSEFTVDPHLSGPADGTKPRQLGMKNGWIYKTIHDIVDSSI